MPRAIFLSPTCMKAPVQAPHHIVSTTADDRAREDLPLFLSCVSRVSIQPKAIALQRTPNCPHSLAICDKQHIGSECLYLTVAHSLGEANDAHLGGCVVRL